MTDKAALASEKKAVPSTGRDRPILYWINQFAVSPREGGGTRHYEMSRGLVARGWDVRIMASDLNLHSREFTRRPFGSKDPVAEEIDGVGFRWLWAAPYQGNDWRRVWNWLTFSWSLWRDARSLPPPDVIIGSSPHLFAALAAERLAARWQVPFVFEVRDLWPESIVAAGGRKGAAYYVLKALARYLYRAADRIVVLARGSQRLLEEMGIPAERLEYVPNGVDTSTFRSARQSRDDSAPFTIAYLGAHGPANGLDSVMEAAGLLYDHTDIRFLFVGDGPAKRGLLGLADELGLSNVEFRDPIPKEEVPRLLAQVDAGLMVLRDAPLFRLAVSPNKLFDYFAAQLPVVCNVQGEVATYVEAAGAGEQTVDASPEALADAVRQLRSRSQTERSKMGKAAFDWVRQNHGRDILADRLDGILRDVKA